MKRTRKWVATTAGPHLLIGEEQLGYWRGTEGWQDHRAPSDFSDYARACRVTTWLGSVSVHDSTAVVLSGDAGDIAWYPNDQGHEGYLVQWLGVDDEGLIEQSLRSEEVRSLLENSTGERLEFETGPSGVMRLIDASERGDSLQDDNEVLRLKPGRHLMRAAYYGSDRLMIVVRQISRL